ncbi:molecular chaperone Hsp33 [Cycloclasticus sp. 46_83_sub15_T18]|nr:molecular chaperone Hsp33 [Cycloclasticus sp. 46_83_sub15_T18]OUR83323.1 molecular chaperone Hsp33 [Cycloclasticus sp. 46_120_T64]
MTENDQDQLHRFLFEDLGIRGEIISLDTSWLAAQANHQYPDAVAEQLGQALAATLLLSATIKFNGTLTLQVQGDGLISMLVAQASEQQSVRGLAHWQQQASAEQAQSLFGNGRLVITIKPEQGESYQGIVNLEGDSILGAVQTYFKQSEQLKTRLWFAINEQRAVGLLLQELPAQQDEEDSWQRIEMLANTITQQELLELPPEQVLYRLFHEEKIRLFEPKPVKFQCDCSKPKVEASLINLGHAEILSILQEKGSVEVDCGYCNQHYHFDTIDIEQLFSEDPNTPSPLLH